LTTAGYFAVKVNPHRANLLDGILAELTPRAFRSNPWTDTDIDIITTNGKADDVLCKGLTFFTLQTMGQPVGGSVSVGLDLA
jgi:hypothetical protein